MSGVIPLEDAQQLVTDRLRQHGMDALQAVQQANQPPLQNVQAPSLPNPQIDPNDIITRLQQHAQDAFQAAQQANQPPFQNVQIDPNEIISRLQQHGQSALQAVDQNVQPITAGLQQLNQPPLQVPQATPAVQGAPGVTPATTPSVAPATAPGPTDQVDSSSHAAFVSSLQPYADKWAKITGIPSDYLMAWAASESNWGKAGNALFGIKQSSQPGTAPGLTSATWEQGQGATTDTFANYNSPDQAFQALDEFLQGSRYRGVYNAIRGGQISADQFMQGINAAGYATDPIWGQKIGQIASNSIQPLMDKLSQGAAQVVGGARQTVANAVLPTLSQFGDRQLTSVEAYAACGPAAAVRFAQMFGRNPTLREAVDLARNVGWTEGQGMAGLQSESKLFDQMGIPHRVLGADWQGFAREAQSGNPVTLSTPGHYFTADGYDPRTGAFHVGSSGTDLRQGKEWMTPAEMEAVMGPLQGGLAADNPNIPGSSPLSRPASGGEATPLERAGTLVQQGVQEGGRALGAGLQVVDDAVRNVAQGVGGAVYAAATDPNAGPIGVTRTAVQNAAQTAMEQAGPQVQGLRDTIANAPVVGGALGMARGPELLSDEEVLRSPQADTARQLLEQFRQADAAKGRDAPPVTDQDVANAARTMMEGQAITMTGRGVGREPLPAGGPVVPGEAPPTPEATRMYHGTGAAFDRPTPGAFDPNGLFGPGYYLTSDPRVAGGTVARGGEQVGTLKLADDMTPVTRYPGEVVAPGYAQERMLTDAGRAQLEKQIRFDSEDLARAQADPTGFGVQERIAHLQDNIAYNQARLDRGTAGANVRAVDVPQNMKLLDADARLTPAELQVIKDAIPPARQPDFQTVVDAQARENAPTGQIVYDALRQAYADKMGASTIAKDVLNSAGYDGITYSGGQRIPMTDAAGAPIEHQATVVFPESLDKIRNAISGRQGGAVDPLLAARLGGAAVGGYAGYQSTPEDASPEERIARTAAGAGAGLVGAHTLVGFAGARPIEQQVLQNLREGLVDPRRRPVQPDRGPIAQVVDFTKQSILSNPATHIANVIGNTIELARQPGALALGGRGADAVAGMSAVGRALPDALGAAVSALRGQQLPSLAERGANIPGSSPIFRALSASDAFTRTLGEYQGMAAEASRLLRDAGMSPNDPGAANYLATHAADLYREGTRAGAQSVFGRVASTGQGTGVLDNIFRTYSNAKEGLLNSPRLRDQAMGALMDFFIPFSGVPVQMLQIGLNRLPVTAQATGAVRAVRALRAGNMGEAQRAVGETGLESMIQLAIAKNVADGNITGPDDPDHPNSVRLNGNWVSMNEWGAYALPMQIMASFADGYEKGGKDVPAGSDVAGYYGPRFAAAFNASMKPFQQGIPGENLLRVISNFGQGGASGAALGLAQDAVNRVTVPGAARFVENLSDPVARDINRKGVSSLWEGPMSNWPGLAQQLPAKIDPTTGDVLNKARSGAGILVGGQQDVESAITQEANRLKKKYPDLNVPSKTYPDTVSIGGADIKLHPTQQRQVTTITGKMLGNFADRLNEPDYQNSDDQRKAQLMQSYLNAAERARTSAVMQVLGSDEVLRQVRAGQKTLGRLNEQATAPELPSPNRLLQQPAGAAA